MPTKRTLAALWSLCAVACLLAPATVSRADETRPVYRDPQTPLEKRVNDLLARMTLEEKVEQLAGDGKGMTTLRNDRLGIPSFEMADGPHGVREGKATCFPCSLALASTWDVDLVRRVAEAMGREFRGKGRYVALAPCINVIRDPRGGRSFETMGEDPHLIARLAVAYVNGIQSQKVIAVPKHYACNNQEDGRTGNDVQVNERALRETYLPAFKACVQQANAWGIMAAYNKVNGSYCAANRHLLRDILKDEWGFPGFVVSDWGACHATIESINGGLDLEMPGDHHFGKPLLAAVKEGHVSEETIDDAARRVLRAKFWAGVFEEPVEPDESAVNTQQHQALALEAARGAIVLLKNRDALLPLDRAKLRSIAVIGPNASVPRPTGGGSSHVTPFYAVSPLEGIRSKAGEGIDVRFAQGCYLGQEGALSPIPATALAPPADAEQQGLLGECFNNPDLEGEPALTRIDPGVNFDWHGGSPADEVSPDRFSVRWTGALIPPRSGRYILGTTSDDGVRLYLDDRLVIDDWRDHAIETRQFQIALEGGRKYQLRLEFYENGGDAVAKLGWVAPGDAAEHIAQAREVARQCDVAIVVAGTSARIECEGRDRLSLDLPGEQDLLIQAVAESNPNTVVVLVSGSAVLMHRWIEQVPAVVQSWFGGQEAGNAVAEVLFGEHNPAGKLPITFPSTADQLPPFDNNYESAGEGRGYRYCDRHKLEPLFPFGHGLSYTEFRYGDLRITPQRVSFAEQVALSIDVQNVGTVAGCEVVQLYVRDLQASVARPPAGLKGFERIHLTPGQRTTVRFSLPAQDLAFFDVESGAFIAEPGRFGVLVGSSSRDIRARGSFVLLGN